MPGESLATTDELATALTRALDRIAALESAGQWWPGMIGWTVGTSAPAGFLVADGSVFDGDRYAALAAVLGSTTLPDLRGKVAVGKSTSGTFATLLGTGGAETVTLNTGQMPAHAHSIPFITSATNQAWTITGAGAAGFTQAGSTSTDSQGGGGSHTNLQPYIVLLPIIHI